MRGPSVQASLQRSRLCAAALAAASLLPGCYGLIGHTGTPVTVPYGPPVRAVIERTGVLFVTGPQIEDGAIVDALMRACGGGGITGVTTLTTERNFIIVQFYTVEGQAFCQNAGWSAAPPAGWTPPAGASPAGAPPPTPAALPPPTPPAAHP